MSTPNNFLWPYLTVMILKPQTEKGWLLNNSPTTVEDPDQFDYSISVGG